MGHKTLIQDNYIPTATMAGSLSRSTPMVDLDWSTSFCTVPAPWRLGC